MKASTIIRILALAVVLSAAGQSAWAQSNSPTFPVNVTFQGLLNEGQYAYVINSDHHKPPYNSGTQDDVNNLGYVRFEEQVFDIGSADVPLTMTVRGNFSFPTITGDATVHGQSAHLVFTSGSKYITAISVSTYDGTPVSVERITATNFSRDVFMLQNTTFGKVTLTMATHTPLDYAATIGGIEATYLDDGVNQPVPTVSYQEGSSPAITLIEGVDYTVTYNVGSTGGSVTVTGMGQYIGSKSKSYSIRQPQLTDFTQLGDGSYRIATKQDLNNLARYVNNGNTCDGITFRQTADIIYSHLAIGEYGYDNETNFTAIGGYGNPFRGTYDGGNFTISGLRICKKGGSNSDRSQGLFGYVGNDTKGTGIVRNVILHDAWIIGYIDTGGIVGFNDGIIEDCIVGADVYIYHLKSADNRGGIAGSNAAGGTISRCTSSASVQGWDYNLNCISGSIVGCLTGGSVSNCLAVNSSVYGGNSPCGAIVGSKTGGTLTSNYYLNCTVNNYRANIGMGSGDTEGARSVHSLTIDNGVNASVTGGETVAIGNETYYVAGTTFTISGASGIAVPAGYCAFEGYSVSYGDGSRIDLGPTGGNFTMPASDATIGYRFTVIPWGGIGTEDDPYVISYPSQLDLLAKQVNGTGGYTANSFSGQYFRLGADITYTHGNADDENNYTCIGNYTFSRPFSGTFDGCGHTVSGIRFYYNGHCSGLFGYVKSGTVKNVVLSDALITGTDIIGGIVGYFDGSAVQNCHVKSNVTIHADGFGSYGGIVGIIVSINGQRIEGCTSAASFTVINGTSNVSIGGIIGYSRNNTIVENCIALGITINADSSIGAVAGRNIGIFSHNYYFNCTVGGNTSNVATVKGDIITNDGAVRASSSATRPVEIGAQIATYPYGGLMVYEHGVYYKGVYYIRADAIALYLTRGAKDGTTAWWGTFYDGIAHYHLTGAQAYTMGTDRKLYRLGNDGSIIPAGTAVVIIASSPDAVLTAIDSASASDYAPGGNQLQGSGSAIPDGKSAYVLSVDANGVIGFRQYTGTDDIPAGKAFYVQ